MNAYWKHNLKYVKNAHMPKEITNPSQDIKQLTSGIFENREITVTGRAWKAVELRLKSDEDLHKLWHVLLKEKLALKSDYYYNNQHHYNMGKQIESNAEKIRLSMARLKNIVQERNTIQNELMRFLEFYYIRKMQHAEKTKDETKEVNPSESKELVPVKRRKFKQTKGEIEYQGEQKTSTSDTEQTSKKKKLESVNSKEPLDPNKVSVLSEHELKVVQNLKKKYINKSHILKDYVKNYQVLSGKERRVVHSKIQSVRAMQAKEIFMKEMAAISYKLKNTEQSQDPEKKKLENLF